MYVRQCANTLPYARNTYIRYPYGETLMSNFLQTPFVRHYQRHQDQYAIGFRPLRRRWCRAQQRTRV